MKVTALIFSDAPLNVIPLHVRGGTVFPLQKDGLNTKIARANAWSLMVTLDDDQKASGELFMDDGVGIGTIENDKYFKVKPIQIVFTEKH